MRRSVFAAAALLCAAIAASVQASSASEIDNRRIEARAVEAAIWGMPAVNYDLMLQEMLSKTERPQPGC